jgi:hypothetical protein
MSSAFSLKKRSRSRSLGHVGTSAQANVRPVAGNGVFNSLKPKITEEYSYNRHSGRTRTQTADALVYASPDFAQLLGSQSFFARSSG